MDSKEVVDKIISKNDEIASAGAERFKDKTIGEHVLNLITKDGDLSVASLIASLQQAVEYGSTAERIKAGPALAYLQQLTGNRSG